MTLTPENEENFENKPLIEVSGLRHTYGSHEVLHLDHWCLQKQVNQLLIGPSGSGKTTLISILTGLMQPTSGEIWIDGDLMSGKGPRQLDKHRVSTFGLVFQDHHLVSSLSIKDNLALAQHFAGQKTDQAWADHLIERLGLKEKQYAKPANLSSGEAQRAAIARAAICKPSIIIADEPTSALDDQNTDRVISLLRDLCDEFAATLLVASHDARIKPYFERSLDLGISQTGAA